VRSLRVLSASVDVVLVNGGLDAFTGPRIGLLEVRGERDLVAVETVGHAVSCSVSLFLSLFFLVDLPRMYALLLFFLVMGGYKKRTTIKTKKKERKTSLFWYGKKIQSF